MNLKALTKSWKTTVAGIATGVIVALVSLGVITEDQAETVAALLIAFGFIVARDGDVSSQDAGIRPK